MHLTFLLSRRVVVDAYPDAVSTTVGRIALIPWIIHARLSVSGALLPGKSSAGRPEADADAVRSSMFGIAVVSRVVDTIVSGIGAGRAGEAAALGINGAFDEDRFERLLRFPPHVLGGTRNADTHAGTVRAAVERITAVVGDVDAGLVPGVGTGFAGEAAAGRAAATDAYARAVCSRITVGLRRVGDAELARGAFRKTPTAA